MDIVNQEIKEDIPIEEVKRSVHSKRAKNETNKYSKESKLKNLELARERKKYLNEIKYKYHNQHNNQHQNHHHNQHNN